MLKEHYEEFVACGHLMRDLERRLAVLKQANLPRGMKDIVKKYYDCLFPDDFLCYLLEEQKK